MRVLLSSWRCGNWRSKVANLLVLRPGKSNLLVLLASKGLAPPFHPQAPLALREGPSGTGGGKAGRGLIASGSNRPLIIRPFTRIRKGGEVWCLRALAQQDGVEAKRPAGRSI